VAKAMLCSSCHAPLPPGARFCPGCGAACPLAGGQVLDTRKVVTVVFCDLVDSTALSGRLDPEILRSVVLRYFDLMRQRLEAYGGTVEKFIGDAIMAVFGVPVMHEDDARRAAAASLDMLRSLSDLNEELAATLDVRLQVRIGVNTGEVVATADAATRQRLVSGEVVNVAARLEQHAGPGQVLVGPETRRAAGGTLLAEPTQPLALKGVAAPVIAYRLFDIRPDDPELVRRFDVPFVGREPELAALHRAARRAGDTGRCQLLAVLGEAGIGKTRLVREWLNGPGRQQAHTGAGRCHSFRDHGSLAPLADALRQLLDGPQPRAAIGSDPQAAAALAMLADGLLATGTPTPSLGEACAATACVLRCLARSRPAVLVLDDCHWADPTLLEAVDRLAEALPGSPVLLVCIARPAVLERWPGWDGDGSGPDQLLVPPLPAPQCRQLAGALSEVSAHATGTAQLLERAGGNPFLLEQLIAARTEGGPGDQLPLTVQGLLAARMDALPGAERAALERAAVVGRDFDLDALASLAGVGGSGFGPAAPAAGAGPGGAGPGGVGPGGAGAAAAGTGGAGPGGGADPEAAARRSAVALLARRRLVEPAPGRPAGCYRFSNALVQEVAYQGIPKLLRSQLHEALAGALEGRGAPDAVVGGHLERACRHRTGLGLRDGHTAGLRTRASTRLTAAGTAALSRGDLSWAADLLAQATELGEPQGPTWTAAAHRFGEALVLLGRSGDGADLLRQVLAAAQQAGDGRTAAHARLNLAVLAPGAGLADLARVARECLPVFGAAADDLGLARAYLRIAQEQQFLGRHGEAGRLLETSFGHAVRADAEPERAMALGAIGISLWVGPDPAEQAIDRCAALLAEHGTDRRVVRLVLNCPLAVLLALRGRADQARARMRAAGQAARELDYAEAAVFLPIFTAQVESLAGRTDRAEALLRQALRAGDPAGEGLLTGAWLDLARVLLRAGDAAQAGSVASRSGAGSAPSEAADRDGILARVAAAQGRAGRAVGLARRAVALAHRTDSPVLQATAALDLAETYRLVGDPARAAGAARLARRRFAGKGHLVGAGWAADFLAGPAAAVSTGQPGQRRPADRTGTPDVQDPAGCRADRSGERT
jgi:class 3 adenylate cyclase/tetratricopeptide (TPR) repeat protein